MFITHRASRQGKRGLQQTRYPGGQEAPKPFLQGDRTYLESGNPKRIRRKPAEIGNSEASGLIIHGATTLPDEGPTDPDSADPPLDGDTLKNPDFPVSFVGAGTLTFTSPIKIPTIVGPVNIQGEIYSNGQLLGGGSNPAILNINSTSTSVSYEATVGTTIGTLSAVGGTAPIVFSIILDADSKFQLSGTNNEVLEVGGAFNYFSAQSHQVTIRATDVNLETYDKIFTITLTVPAHTSTNCLHINDGATTDEYMSRTITGEDLNFGTDFTIAFWLRYDSVDASFGMFTIGTDNTNQKINFNNQGTSGNLIRFAIFDDSGNKEDFYDPSPSSNINDGMWHHVLLSYSEDDSQYWLDGVLQGNTYFTNNNMSANLKTATTMLIGSRFNPPSTVASDAKYREIVMFDIQLSSLEVAELYNSGSANYHPASHSRFLDIVAWYDCQSMNASGEILDRGPNGYTLTGNNVDSATNIVAA